MTSPSNVLKLLGSTIRYGAASRRWSLVIMVVLGLVLAVAVVVAKVVAPLALYPFA